MLVPPLLALVMAAGCQSKQPQGPEQGQSSPSGSAPGAAGHSASDFKVYKLRGKVVNTNPRTGEVTVDHGPIPGFMEAMTMPYKLRDPGVLSELHPGDVITADVLVSQSADAQVLLDHIVIVAQARADYRPAEVYHVPAQGDRVPDFALRNQDGRRIHLAQFRGRQLLVTFLYTRCPMPDFCPRVTRHFASLERQLAADPGLYGRTHLLCVSFDPDNDTPARLRAYATGYIGADRAGSALRHWDFAVPDKAVVGEMARFFNVGMTPGEDGTINHTLSTTLIGADGAVEQFYPGNEWTPEQVMGDVKRAASGM